MLKTLLINDDLYTLVITLTFGKADGAKVKFAVNSGGTLVSS